jgi:hypothetical protein
MSPVTDLCQDSDDASVPAPPLSGKRPRDKKESSNDAHTRNMNGPRNKTATGSVEIVVDLECADEVGVVSPRKKRRGVVRSKRSGKNKAAGKCAPIVIKVQATKKGVRSEDAQVVGHRESREGIAAAAAASHPMDSDLSDQRSRGGGFANEHSERRLTSKPLSNTSGRQGGYSAWGDRLSELANYRKIHGHCNIPYNYSENIQLAYWVGTQRSQYRLHQEGKRSNMTTSRIQELESLGFVWGVCSIAWEDCLSEFADYCEKHGHCNVPQKYSENAKLGRWVETQRKQYRLHLEGKRSPMTLPRIQVLESLGFEWDSYDATCEDRLIELADYRKIHGHCNVPQNYIENSKLANWVTNQRRNYRLHREGKKSPMTLSRIQALESLGFEWSKVCFTAWEDRLRELADYRKKHGHCNVPHNNCSDNIKLATWVSHQRTHHRFRLEGKRSPITLPRIRALESLGFEWKWKPSLSRMKGKQKKTSFNDDATHVLDKAVESPEHMQQHSQKISAAEKTVVIKSAPPSNPKNPTGMAKYTSTSSRVECQNKERLKTGDTRFDEIDLDGSPSELAATPSLFSDRQAAKSLSLDMSAPDGDSVESSTRKDALQTKVSWLAHQQKSIDRSAGNAVQAISDEPANAPQDAQQTPPDQFFQSDNVLNEVELELNWLGEESMYCLSCPEFQFDFIYEYASPALKVELRKLSRDDQSEKDKVKQIVRMDDWLVSRRFDFARNYIRKMLGRGFRRQRMGTVIAELRLLRRQHSKRHFRL